jgi:hypothetical protein
MTQLLTHVRTKTNTRPLDGSRALVAASEYAAQVSREMAENPDFDYALMAIETVVARYRAACLAQVHAEADAAIAYHNEAIAELNEDFAPLYYRRAVLENVAARYERSTKLMLRALA